MTAEELKNVAGFKAVDAEGNELGVVSLSDIVSAVKQELQPSGVARASVAALSEVSAQAATDTYEDQLPQKTDVTWIRGLDESGNPILISKQSLVSVAEGLMLPFVFKSGTFQIPDLGSVLDLLTTDILNGAYEVLGISANDPIKDWGMLLVFENIAFFKPLNQKDTLVMFVRNGSTNNWRNEYYTLKGSAHGI